MRRALLSLALLASALAAPVAAADLSELAGRYVAWRGGAAFERMQSYHLSGELKAAGLSGVTQEWRDRAGLARDDFDLGVVKGASVLGPDAWTVQANGVVEDMPPATVQDTRRDIALKFADALSDKGGALVRVLDEERRDGRTWAVLRVGFGGPDTFDLFVDPTTGELDGIRSVVDRKSKFTRMADWRLVDGVRLPFLIEETTANPAETTTVRVRSAEVNRPIPPELLARPQSHRLAMFSGPSPTTGPLPFRYYNGVRIYIPAVVNGRKVDVLLDSGADVSVIDKAFAASLGVKPQGKGVGSGTGGQTEFSFAEGVDIQIGSMRLQDPAVAITDLSDVSRRLALPMPVILGADVFKQLVVDIDFDRAAIAFSDPAGFKPPPNATAVPVTRTEGVPTLPVSLDGRTEIPVEFDLGNGGYFTLFPAWWQAHGPKPRSRTLGGAVGGAREEDLTTTPTVTFAGVTFRDVPTMLSLPGPTAMDSNRTLGNIGQSILNRFRLITDYPRGRIYVIPYPDAATRPFRKDRAGLRVVQEGGALKVTYVSPGSPAEAGGWSAGQLITAIDGQPVTSTYAGSDLSLWMYRHAGDRVILTLSNGSRRTLTLKDYF